MTKAQKQYIDENHKHESVSIMAKALNLTETTVIGYMNASNYKATRRGFYKPDTTEAKAGYFDVVKYFQNNSTN
jgi:hypothetical protein